MDQFGLGEIEVKKEVLRSCNENILLIDSSKFNKQGTYNWLKIGKVNKIITDPGIDREVLNKLLKKGIEVIY